MWGYTSSIDWSFNLSSGLSFIKAQRVFTRRCKKRHRFVGFISNIFLSFCKNNSWIDGCKIQIFSNLSLFAPVSEFKEFITYHLSLIVTYLKKKKKKLHWWLQKVIFFNLSSLVPVNEFKELLTYLLNLMVSGYIL